MGFGFKKMIRIQSSSRPPSTTNRRRFLRGAGLTAAGLLAQSSSFARALPTQLTTPVPSAHPPAPDYRIEIAEIDWEIAPKKKIRTTAYDGQVPGKLIRVKAGKPVSVEIVNRSDHAEIVHWHGQWIPSDVDGSMEEGTPMIPPGTSTRIRFTPRPSGLHWYHTHAMANHGTKHGLYTGQFGMLLVEPHLAPAPYDQEIFLALHDWEPYFLPSDDGSLMVNYVSSTINGRQLGHDDPIQVRAGQQVLFQILNASATEPHWLVFPGHTFQVIALDGRPVATQAKVQLLRLGPAERITALVAMNTPGVWILGEAQAAFRNAGMGTIIEYAGCTGKPQSSQQPRLAWDYRAFGDPVPVTHKPDITIPLVFTSRFKGHGATDQWMINGKSFPETDPVILKEGLRHRLVFDNRSTDDHPIHLHRHSFELVSIKGARLSGVHKDVVVVEGNSVVEADLLATNPGNTLFHCHQQDHMDAGFMTLFHYA